MSALLVLSDGHEHANELELTLRERVERATDYAPSRADDGSLVIELSVYPLADPIQLPAINAPEGIWRRMVRRLSGRGSQPSVRTVPRGKGER